uniref:Uncharacterized protein n=1 Tax=Strongyloides papillosus TaxID=174720 RepID=A0A0N5BFH7_STREA
MAVSSLLLKSRFLNVNNIFSTLFLVILIGFFFTPVYPLRGALMRSGRSFDEIDGVVPINRPKRLLPFQRSPKILRRMLNNGQYHLLDNFYDGMTPNQEMYENGYKLL